MSYELPAPVRGDGPPPMHSLSDGIALCLSGGGYRAALFHLGSIWRLNEAGILSRIDRVSSTSGGSLTGAALGCAWDRLGWENGVASRYESEVVIPVRSLTSRSCDVPAIIAGMLLPGSPAEHAARLYDRHLFHGATLGSLPDAPAFVFNAANVQTGSLWRFQKSGMRDWRLGTIVRPDLPVAVAVAGSAAFPPFLSPLRLRFGEEEWEPSSGEELHRPPFTTDVHLTDGGCYDNLSLETVWKRYRTILVSDACGRVGDAPRPRTDWIGHFIRAAELVNAQISMLRKRQLIGSFAAGARKGTYWGIGSHIADYHLTDAMECPPERTFELETVPTRLSALPDALQERLINWGYAICDAAVRRWMLPDLPRPVRFPYSRGV